MNRKQRKRRRAKRRVSTSGDRSKGRRALNGGSGIQETEVELEMEDEAQAAAFREEFSQFAAQAPEQIKALRENLIEVLSPFDAFDILANAWMANTPLNSNTYRESDMEGLMAIPDYVALLCVQRDSRKPTAKAERLIDGCLIDQINELVKQILSLTDLHLSYEARNEGSAFEHLRGRMVSRRMYVQGPGFDFQERELLAALFDDAQTKEDLLSSIGFTAEEGLAIGDAIMEVSLKKFFERSQGGRAVPKVIEQSLQQGEDLGLPTEQLSKMPKAERAKRLQQLGKIYTFSDLGSTMQVGAAEIAAESGISSDRVTAFLDAFSMPFGQSSISALGTEVQRARERPLINDGEGNYLLVSHLALFWALRPALESCLKDKGGAWHRFRRRRAALVESSALRYLKDAMPGSVAYESVSFELEKEGLKTRYEIDGLLVCDTIMLIVEGKSASLTAAGRRGAPARVEKHLKEILVKAAEQAERARKALDQGESCFFSSDGVEIELPKQISEIFPIVVTLEDLSDVTTMIWELEEADLLPAEIPTPWALSLFELELICDLNEYTAMLIHFLRRRARLNVLRCVHVSDELDWWMCYLERGLYFERDLEGPDAPRGISLMSMTDPLDAYYLWRRGDRTKPAKKPRQKLQRDLRALLDCLHERALPGHVEASVALLEMDDRGRRELTRGFRRIREMTEADGMFHDMSMLVGRDGSLGITFIAGPGSDLNALERRLGLYSMAKKHQSRLRRWVSFGWCADTPGLLDLVGLIVGDWRPDEDLDRLLEEMELAPSRPLNQSDPNPNFRLPGIGLRPPPKAKRK